MRRQGAGFTLIEVLIAVLVLSVGLTGLARFQGGVFRSAGHAKSRTEALSYAEQKIEELRDFSTQAGYDAIADGTDTVAGTAATFARVWVVTANTSPEYKQVAVSVLWKDPTHETGDAPEEVRVTSAIAGVDPSESGELLASGVP